MDYHAAIAAVLSLIACIAAVLALALPLWAWTPNMNVSAMGEMSRLEIGVWKACTLAQYRGETVRDCWSLVHDQVGPAFIAGAVLYIVGVAAGFVSFIMLLVLAMTALGRDGAARVCVVLTVLTELFYAAAFGCAVGGLNESRNSADDFMDMPGMRYGASFYLGIVAMIVGLAAIPFAARVGFRTIVV